MTKRHPVLILFGPLVWVAHFIVVYASESLLCRLLTASTHTILVAAVTVLTLVILWRDMAAWRGLILEDQTTDFISKARVALDALSMFAIALVSAAGLAISACR